MKLGNLVVEITADSDKFVAGVAATETRLDNLSKRARSAVNTFGKYSLAAGAAGAAVTTALYVKASQAIDAQAKLAQRLDTTSASMAVLGRAGELSGVSLEKVAQGSSDLTRRLSQASKNGGPVKEALDSIGLSARDLQAIPLDKRIEQINAALLENADASQRAALAGQLFGEEGSLFMTQISPEVLAQARRETELFGLALSDVDAAKVEQANDAFSTFGSAADGIIQQMTVQLAPIVKAISDEFLNAADEAGGFGDIALEAFDKVINAAAFVANAADGIKRTFELTADGIIVAVNSAMATVSSIVADVLSGISSIPGIDFSETINSLNEFSETSENVVSQAWSNIDETLSRPFAGDSFKSFVDNARVAGEAAAQAAVAARVGMTGAEGEQQAVGLTQQEQEALNSRIEAIRQANATEMEALLTKQAAEIEAINAHEELKLTNYQAWADLMLETKLRHEDEITDIEQRAAEARQAVAEQEAAAKRQAMGDMFSNLTSLMNTNSRALFNVGKAAAMAQIALSIPASASKAYEGGLTASGGNVAVGAAFAAAATVAQLNQLNNIRGQQFGGGGGAAAPIGQGASNVAAQPTTTQQPTQTMMVSGIDEGELFTGGRVRAIVGELLEYQRNGGQVILA